MLKTPSLGSAGAGLDLPVSPEIRRRRKRRHWAMGSAAVVVLATITAGVARLKPAAPLVEKSSLWTDTVKRGEMFRQVRGNGTLVPEDVRWIPTINAGRVEQILVLPGTAVESNTVVVKLSNPEVVQAAFDVEWQLKGAEAELANLRVQLKTDKLTLKKAVASAEADYTGAKLELEVDDVLTKSGIEPQVTLKQSRAKAEGLARLFEIEQECLDAADESAKAQLDVQEAKVSQLRAQLDLKNMQVEALNIRAGMDGVLERLGDPTSPLQLGQQVAAGAPIARVANPAKLKAQIKIPETQAKDVLLDQEAEIDTRNGIAHGHIVRVDPAVQDGTITVDVTLDEALPKGARPDLTVDGTIEIERLENVMHVGRPVQGQEDSEVSLFKLTDNGTAAIRVPVKLGKSSVSSVEILNGLQVGDRIILSDMSQWDTSARVRLE